VTQNRSYFSNLFFIRRSPRLRGALQEWVQPDDATYQTLVHEHRFVTVKDIEEYIQGKAPGLSLADFPTITDDLRMLNGDSYLHDYFSYDHSATHYQNTFYLYNWVFAVGAFTTALLGFLSIVLSSSLIWILTGFIGFVTTVYTFKNNREVPQREWYVNRRRAETLRSHYYQYLAQVPPYHGSNENREIRLLQTAIQVGIMGKRRQGTQAVQPSVDMGMEPHPVANLTQTEADFLRAMFLTKRLRYQEQFYANRISEFRQNSSFTHTVAAILMGLSTLIAGWSAITNSSIIPLLVVLLPSAAAMFVSFQQIYSWERQLTLYDETLDQLKNAQIPLLIKAEESIPVARLTDTIAACEVVFSAECDQWGQDVLNSNVPDRDKVLQEMFDAQLERLGLSDDQKQNVYSIIQSTHTVDRNPAPTEVNVPNEGGG
jgi:hypothetical protein